MRKHAVIIVLSALQLLALALMLLFWLVMRPDLIITYGLDGARVADVPTATKLALSGWFVPLVGATGALLVLVALLGRWRAKARTELSSVGLVWMVLGLAFAIWAAYAPVFERLGSRDARPAIATLSGGWPGLGSLSAGSGLAPDP
jgi:hypothetical protein